MATPAGGLAAGTQGTLPPNFNPASGYPAIINSVIPKLPSITASVTPASCGLTNGVVKLTAKDGTSPYQYSKDGTTFQISDTFENLAKGNYTFYVKDSKGEKGSLVVEVDEGKVLITETGKLSNLRVNEAESVYDIGTIFVTHSGKSKELNFVSGLKGYYNDFTKVLKIDNPLPNGFSPSLTGSYEAFFNVESPYNFELFYKINYTGTCTPSGYTWNESGKCNIICQEAILPAYLYDAENSVLVKAFKAYYKGKETDANYPKILALIKKLEPLGLVKQTDNHPFLNIDLVTLLKALEAADETLTGNTTKLKSLINNSTDRCALLEALWAINRMQNGDAILKGLTLADRKLAIKRLAEGGNLTGSDEFWCFGSNGGEESVLRLLKITPTGEQKSLLDYMTSQELSSFSAPGKHNSILSALEYRMNDDNYDTYMAIMIQWSNDNYPTQYSDFNSIINHVKTPKNIFYLGPTTQSYTKKYIFEEGGQSYIHFDVVKDGSSIIRENVEVNDRVFVYFDKNFTYGTDTFEAGKSYEIPALLCYHIMELMDRRVYEMKKSIVTNGLLIAFGIGEIRAATGLWDLGVALGMIDMGIGVSGIVMDAGLAQQLSLTPKGREYLEYYHKFVLIYGAARLVSDLSGLTQALRAEATAINDARVLTFTDEITLKYLNKWYPEVYAGIKDFDLATQRLFFDDFLNLEGAEAYLGGLELNPNAVKVWRNNMNHPARTDIEWLKIHPLNGYPFRSTTKVPLNSTDLAKKALNYRITNNAWHDGNIVVVEYTDNAGNVQELLMETTGNGGTHTERLAIDKLKADGIPLTNIKRLYSELEPCEVPDGGRGPGGCMYMIYDEIGGNLEITFSYEYKGTSNLSRELRVQSLQLRKNDFLQYK